MGVLASQVIRIALLKTVEESSVELHVRSGKEYHWQRYSTDKRQPSRSCPSSESTKMWQMLWDSICDVENQNRHLLLDYLLKSPMINKSRRHILWKANPITYQRHTSLAAASNRTYNTDVSAPSERDVLPFPPVLSLMAACTWVVNTSMRSMTRILDLVP